MTFFKKKNPKNLTKFWKQVDPTDHYHTVVNPPIGQPFAFFVVSITPSNFHAWATILPRPKTSGSDFTINPKKFKTHS